MDPLRLGLAQLKAQHRSRKGFALVARGIGAAIDLVVDPVPALLQDHSGDGCRAELVKPVLVQVDHRRAGGASGTEGAQGCGQLLGAAQIQAHAAFACLKRGQEGLGALMPARWGEVVLPAEERLKSAQCCGLSEKMNEQLLGRRQGLLQLVTCGNLIPIACQAKDGLSHESVNVVGWEIGLSYNLH